MAVPSRLPSGILSASRSIDIPVPTTPGKRKQDLGNQMLGLLLALCLFVLFIVWMVDVPAILRYGATGIIAGLLAVRALYAAGQRRKIERIRTQQFRAHRSKGQD